MQFLVSLLSLCREMHLFIAWKTEKNKIHFSEHVHEPAIIFLCECANVIFC